MTADRKAEDYWWCRGCATKFRVKYSVLDGSVGSLRIDVYHNFGASSVVAMRNFEHLVKKTGNDDMACLSRTFPDFDCESATLKELDEGRQVLLAIDRSMA